MLEALPSCSKNGTAEPALGSRFPEFTSRRTGQGRAEPSGTALELPGGEEQFYILMGVGLQIHVHVKFQTWALLMPLYF